MESIELAITGFLLSHNSPAGYLVLAAAALLEYVFPPFPGDMVTLFGAFLVTRHGFSLPVTFLSVLAGSGAGAMVNFAVGARMRGPYEQGRFLRSEKTRKHIDRVLQAFRRYGAIYVIVNRFLPAVRAVFFVAAGLAGLRPLPVLAYALLSAAAWNAMVIAVGRVLGANWERIRDLARLYSVGVWILLGVGVLGWLLVSLWRRRRAP